MKNSFYVTACRFHTKIKNKLLIIGYFSNNIMEGNCPVIMLDDMELDYISEERRWNPVSFKEVNGKMITQEYFLWAQLPENWKDYKELNIFNGFSRRKELVININRETLLECEQRIAKNIDLAMKEADGFKVAGWYINTGNTKISFWDATGNEIPMEITHIGREDVAMAYPENDRNEIYGFEARCKGKAPKKIRVHFETDGKQNDEWVKIGKTTTPSRFGKVKELAAKAYVYYRQFGLEATLMRVEDKVTKHECTNYDQLAKRRRPSKGVLKRQGKEVFEYMPKISIVVPLYRTPLNYLREMISSVQKQSYTNWELCLSDGSGENSPLTQILNKYAKRDSRIRVVHNQKQLHISANTNEALKICTGDYIAFMDHDDVLAPNALYECVCVLDEDPETELIYTDEDKINMDGSEYFQPHFKSDYNLDLLRGTNYFCHLVVVKRELYQQVGDLNPLCDGAQDYDFVLRCVEKTDKIVHIPKILYHWRAHQNSTALSPESKAYIVEAGKRAIEGHYARLGIDAEVIPTWAPGMYRTKYALKEKPLVSIIIPNKDHIDDLKKCIQSIEEKSTYENLEYIVVENNSQEKRTFRNYKKLEAKNKRLKVVYWDGVGFNYPAINNFGIKHAKGDYILLLNNDTEIINPDCIEELLMYCVRDDVGAVGARLYYEDGTIQHAGVIGGLGGVAGHAFLGFGHDDPGYFGRAMLAQDLSAVTAACLMVKRSVYEEVGGLDEAFAVAFNDVDLCMKIRKAGHLIVYNPYAELSHYESKSRGYEDTEEKLKRFHSEIQLFQTRWRVFLEQGDPYYNPNLVLDRNDFSVNLLKR